MEEIAASKIYRQVFEDNQKFEFDNDIYSQEFYDFVKGVLLAVKESIALSQSSDSALIQSIKKNAVDIGKKTILDLLAKSFHNASIKQLCEALNDIFKEDESLCGTFLQACYDEDQWAYLMEVLLECTDAQARLHVGALLKSIVNRLKLHEKAILFEQETITTTDGKGETTTVTQPASLVARFIMKCLSLLNTQVAKNWSRFEYFFDVLYAFGLGEDPALAN